MSFHFRMFRLAYGAKPLTRVIPWYVRTGWLKRELGLMLVEFDFQIRAWRAGAMGKVWAAVTGLMLICGAIQQATKAGEKSKNWNFRSAALLNAYAEWIREVADSHKRHAERLDKRLNWIEAQANE